jgi:hypothetical protein
VIRYVPISIINISLLVSSLQAMESTTSNIQTKNQEEIEVETLIQNGYYMPEMRHIKGLISAIYPMNEHTIGIVESDTAGDSFSTLHVYNKNKNSWHNRIISSEERRLAECGFDIEAMDIAKQNCVVNTLKSLNVWNSKVPPITTNNGHTIFVDTANKIITVDSQKLTPRSSFALPAYIPSYKEICLYPSNSNNIILSTNTIDNGIVHVFLSDGMHFFSDTPNDNAGKPEIVIEGNNTIAIGREHSTQIYTYDPLVLCPKPLYCYKGNLVDWYNNKAIITHDYKVHVIPQENTDCTNTSSLRVKKTSILTPDGKIIQTQTRDFYAKSSVYAAIVFRLGNGLFGIINKENMDRVKVKIFDSYLHCIQKMNPSEDGKKIFEKLLISYTNEQQVIDFHQPIYRNRIPLIHTAINKVIPSATGYPMFSVHKGLLMFFNQKPYNFATKPTTREEFYFLARQDKDPYQLYKTIRSGKHTTIELCELITYFCIPEQVRKKLIETENIYSHLNFHTMVLSQEEKQYIKDANSKYLDNALKKVITSYDSYLFRLCSFYKKSYEEIPARFRNIIEHYYANLQNNEGYCIIL